MVGFPVHHDISLTSEFALFPGRPVQALAIHLIRSSDSIFISHLLQLLLWHLSSRIRAAFAPLPTDLSICPPSPIHVHRLSYILSISPLDGDQGQLPWKGLLPPASHPSLALPQLSRMHIRPCHSPAVTHDESILLGKATLTLSSWHPQPCLSYSQRGRLLFCSVHIGLSPLPKSATSFTPSDLSHTMPSPIIPPSCPFNRHFLWCLGLHAGPGVCYQVPYLWATSPALVGIF